MRVCIFFGSYVPLVDFEPNPLVDALPLLRQRHEVVVAAPRRLVADAQVELFPFYNGAAAGGGSSPIAVIESGELRRVESGFAGCEAGIDASMSNLFGFNQWRHGIPTVVLLRGLITPTYNRNIAVFSEVHASMLGYRGVKARTIRLGAVDLGASPPALSNKVLFIGRPSPGVVDQLIGVAKSAPSVRFRWVLYPLSDSELFGYGRAVTASMSLPNVEVIVPRTRGLPEFRQSLFKSAAHVLALPSPVVDGFMVEALRVGAHVVSPRNPIAAEYGARVVPPDSLADVLASERPPASPRSDLSLESMVDQLDELLKQVVSGGWG